MTKVKFTILLCLAALLFCSVSFAQKEDANWVFGYNCGLHFENDTVTTFNTGLFTFETAASISNKAGDLILCIGWKDKFEAFGASVFDGEGNMVHHGSDINLYGTFAQGAIFLPIIDDGKYLLIHHGLFVNSCADNLHCPHLYASYIENTDSGWTVTRSNIHLVNAVVDESLAITRHANGKDWWIISHRGNELNTDCNDVFFVLRTENGNILPPVEYKKGQSSCGVGVGMMKFSQSGSKLVYAEVFDWEVEIFDFDRCSGNISNPEKIQLPGNSMPYGIEFSPSERFLYVSSDKGYINPQGNELGTLFQVDLDSNIRYEVWQDSSNQFMPGLLKAGPDNKIYMAYSSSYAIFLNYNFRNQNLSFINSPDSLGAACDFRPFHIYLGDSSYSSLSLPNMPNYNLGALPVYLADAGDDTYYCHGDSTVKGVRIGGDSVPGVTYQWLPGFGIDSLNAPNHLVRPPQSQWYYVTITDTTYTGPSCASRLDSVYVQVRTCTDITETATLAANLYPNPTTGTLTVELPGGQGGSITLYSLLGQRLLQAPLGNGTTTITLNQPPGLYLYQINTPGHTQNGKLLVE